MALVDDQESSQHAVLSAASVMRIVVMMKYVIMIGFMNSGNYIYFY